MRKLSVVIPHIWWEELTEYCKVFGLTKSEVIKTAIQMYLEKQSWDYKTKRIDEGYEKLAKCIVIGYGDE